LLRGIAASHFPNLAPYQPFSKGSRRKGLKYQEIRLIVEDYGGLLFWEVQMWFIFVLPMAVASGVAALFTVTGGMNFVIFAVAGAEWQRRRGHKAGEGRLSEREGGVYYGVGMDDKSDHDISRDLGRLAHYAPKSFEPFTNKRYDFTKSEGILLRAILAPAIKSLNEFEEIKTILDQDPNHDDLQEALFTAIDNLATLLGPIIVYLEQFPEKRVKKVNADDSSR
jgi:hypothetical protein